MSRKQWIVCVRETYTSNRVNKKPYTVFTFHYASEVREFLKSVVNYGMKPLDIKVFYSGKEV